MNWKRRVKKLKTHHSENKDHGIWSHHFMGNRCGNNGNSDTLFWGAPKSMQIVTASHEIKRCMLLGRKAMTNIDSLLKSRFITLLTKVHIVKAMDFFSSHVWMWESDHREGWVMKNWGFWTVVLEKTLESPLDCKVIQPAHPKGNQSWIFIGRTDAEAETPILWPPDAKSWLIGKDSDAGKDWGQEEKGTTEDEMLGLYHWLNGYEFNQASGVGDGSEVWRAAVHGVTKSRTRLSNWT